MRIAKSLLVLAVGLASQGVSGVPAHAQTFLTNARNTTSPTGGQAFFPVEWGGEAFSQSRIGTPLQDDLVMFKIVSLAAFPPVDTVFGTVNGFFAASQYTINCSSSVMIVNDPGGEPITFGPFGQPGLRAPPVQVPLCSATSVPVVEASFLDQLSAAGIDYDVVYPIQDNGNGRGYVVWNSRDWTWGGPRQHDGDMFPGTLGYARIEGVGWQNQFQSETFQSPSQGLSGPTVTGSSTAPFGDAAGAFINSLSSPLRQTTLRLAAPQREATVATQISGYTATMVTDPWLSESLPPPPPSLTPPVASTQTPSAGAINIGSASTGAGSGSGTGGSGFAVNNSGFNWAAYCNSPDSLGNVRSPLWVQSCLAAELP